MALKSKATKAEFVSADESNRLKLSARFANLEKLADHTGEKPLQFIGTVLSPLDVKPGENVDLDKLARNVTSLFYCLQDEAESYSEEDVYDAFFGNTTDFFTNEKNVLNLLSVTGHLMGEDRAALIAEIEEKMKAPPKKAR